MVITVKFMNDSKTAKCQHCNKSTSLVTGDFIYNHRPDLHTLNFWYCANCRAYVGCHKKGARTQFGISDGTLPLGTAANARLRELRKDAHNVFDNLWKNQEFSRDGAYLQLAYYLRIKKDDCHMALFDDEQCKKVIKFCYSLMRK